MNRQLVAEEARRRRLRSIRGIAAIALWGAGCCLLYLAWSLAQVLPPPINHVLSTAVYLITFFYIFAVWPIQSLVERLFDGTGVGTGSALKSRSRRARSATARAAPPRT